MTSLPNIPLVDLSGIHAELRGQLDDAWAKVVDGSAFILSAYVERFENEWAEYCGTDHCVGVGSGTEAIELALRALGVGPGDEVVVPASTFSATAAAVSATGAKPVFTDVDPGSLLITADHLRAALSPRTVAVLPVHLYGTAVDMSGLGAVAASAGIAVVEDCAQAHGATHNGQRTGSLGTIGAFSHYPTKNLGAFGDGGTITTNDASLAAKVRLLGNHGRPNQRATDYTIVGRTGRLDGLQAAILSVKLTTLDKTNAARRDVVGWYDAMLPSGIRRFADAKPEQSSPHLCVVRVPGDRDAVREKLQAVGIGNGIHYPDPVPRTTAFGGLRGAFPVAEAAADSMISLPLWAGLSFDQVERVCEAVRDAC
jgi:dTDP-4-amino-4,6-dideoxygalactose transaminase